MRINEVISALKEIKKEHGNLDCVVRDLYSSGYKSRLYISADKIDENELVIVIEHE